MRPPWVVFGFVTLATCGFDTSGGTAGGKLGGEGEADDGDADTGSGATDAPDVSASGTSAATSAASGESGTTGDDPTGDGMVGDSALLEISGAPSIDFGLVTLGSPKSLTIDVVNVGGASATSIVASPLAPAFSFAGGSYPGSGGTCGEVLDAGASCSVVVTASPTAPIHEDGELALDYAAGDGPAAAKRSLRASGVTSNLIANGGAESASVAPWLVQGAWTTTCYQVSPHSGSRCFFAGIDSYSPDQSILQQDIALDPSWAPFIDAGQVQFVFGSSARARSGSLGDDWRIVVDFHDANGELGVLTDSGWQPNTSWTAVEAGVLGAVGTRSIRIRLGCLKPSSAIYCDAYFDTLSLVARPAD